MVQLYPSRLPSRSSSCWAGLRFDFGIHIFFLIFLRSLGRLRLILGIFGGLENSGEILENCWALGGLEENVCQASPFIVVLVLALHASDPHLVPPLNVESSWIFSEFNLKVWIFVLIFFSDCFRFIRPDCLLEDLYFGLASGLILGFKLGLLCLLSKRREIGRACVGKECTIQCRSRWSPYH